MSWSACQWGGSDNNIFLISLSLPIHSGESRMRLKVDLFKKKLDDKSKYSNGSGRDKQVSLVKRVRSVFIFSRADGSNVAMNSAF